MLLTIVVAFAVALTLYGMSLGQYSYPTQSELKEIEQAMAMGNMPMANALIELVKETMLRLGDESDPDRFIPRQPPPGSPGAGGPPPAVQPQVSIKLSGQLTTATSEQMAAPVLARDAASAPPPSPAPGAPAPGTPPQTASPAAPPGAGPI